MKLNLFGNIFPERYTFGNLRGGGKVCLIFLAMPKLRFSCWLRFYKLISVIEVFGYALLTEIQKLSSDIIKTLRK